ncbi:MAG TPA: FAD:protein FMN transferase [Rudaea sp.]|nr:FAD:protein FMN transferase [Rudaea sp.]
MGCPCALHLEADATSIAQAAHAAVVVECMRLERKYSHYRDDSLVARIAASAGSDIEIDDETADLLDFAAALHAQSGGLFDISAGALTRLWDAQNGRLPDPSEITLALAVSGWRRVQWRRPRLRLDVPGMRLDLGGIVKEYAADRCAKICRDAGVTAGVVDLGGDLALIGPHRDGSAWVVGIKAPHVSGHAAARIELPRGGLATSGDYERALIVDGRRYSHIVDPGSGEPVQSFASVSVVAESCLVAGAAATLAMLMGRQRGGAYLRELGLPHLVIRDDGSIDGDIVRIA